jgi:hypothetical protein
VHHGEDAAGFGVEEVADEGWVVYRGGGGGAPLGGLRVAGAWVEKIWTERRSSYIIPHKRLAWSSVLRLRASHCLIWALLWR